MAAASHYQRGDEISVTVTRHMHYGVLVQDDDGGRGWIASDYISDRRLSQSQWPAAGTRLTGLVLGYGSLDRVRVCLRHVDGKLSPDQWPPDLEPPSKP